MNRMTRNVFVQFTRSQAKGKNVLLLLLLLLTTLFLSGLVSPQSLLAAPGDITTIAGGGVGDTGLATSASLYLPRGIHVTASGVIYIADTLNHLVRKIDTNGIITTVAGNGLPGFSGDGGPAASASLNYPLGITVDHAGNIFIADAHNHRVRKVNASGIISTIIGGGAENAGNYCSLSATDAGTLFPRDIFLDSSDRVHIIDGQLWRLETDGTLINLSDPSCGYGSLEPGFSNGFFDASGVFIYGSGNNIFRTTDMQTSTLFGVFSTGAPGPFTALSGDAFGNVYVASPQSNIVYKFDQAGTSTVFAGTGTAGYSGDGGNAVSANLSNPTDVFGDAAGNVYIADRFNHRIRKVDPNGMILTVAGSGEAGYAGEGLTATSERLNVPRAVFADSIGNVYIADTYNHRIRKVDTAGTMTTIAGNGASDFSGDGGPATAAGLSYPSGIFVHSDGSIYIADSFNDRIRKIDPTGTITTIAGTEDTGYAGDGGPATLAVLNYPTGIIADSTGNIFIADLGSNAIRKIDPSGIISTYANIVSPRSVAIDSSGVLYVATDYDGINRVYPTGTVDLMPSCADAVGVSVDSTDTVYVVCQRSSTVIKKAPGMAPQTIAGTGSEGFSGDGGSATAAMLASPSSVFADFSGTIYIADSGNNRIRRIAGGLEPSVVIQSPAAGFTNNNIQLLSYTVSSGTVVVKVDGIVVNKVSGNNLDPLADGPHAVRVEVSNEFSTGYAERTFTVDTVTPIVTIISPTSGTTNDSQPVLAYAVSEGVVTVKVDGVVINKVSGSRLDLLSNGSHALHVESRDAAGNIGSADIGFVVAAPPIVTITSPAADITSTNTPLLVYATSDGTVVVTVDGAVVNTPSGGLLAPLADGPHAVRVEATNVNGTGFAERTFSVDTTAPAIAITSPALGVTIDNQPLLTYTVSDGLVKVLVDGNVVTKVSGGRLFILQNGPHTVRVEAQDGVGNIGAAEVAFIVSAPIERITEDFETGDLGKLPWITSGNGLWSVTSAVTHSGLYAAEAPRSIGNNQNASLSVTRKTAADTISFWYSVSSEHNYDYLIFLIDNVTKGMWSGTVPWTQVSYVVSAGTHTFQWVYSKDGSVSAGADTAWIDDIVFPMPPAPPMVTITSPAVGITNNNTPLLTYTVSGGTVVVKIDSVVVNKVSGSMLDFLADGNHIVRVEATDTNGTGFAERTFTVDTIAPTVAINSPIAGTINTKSPVINYTVSDGSLVVKVDGNVVSKVSGTTLDPLADGIHTVMIESTDVAGNTGFAEVTFTVDTTAPTVSIVSPIAGATNNNHPVLTYTVSDGTVVVKVDGVVEPKVSGNTLETLAEGSHTVRVESTDAAGNAGFAEVTFTVDTIAPTINLSSPVAGSTKNNMPLLTYTASDGVAIVKVDGVIVSKISGNNLDVLTDGTHTVRVESTDAASNVGFAEATVVVDTVPPAININPVTTPANANAQTITGARESGATVVVTLNTAATAGALSYPNDTAWSCTINGLVEGINTITVTATDSVGNSAVAIASIAYDSVAPTVTISSPSAGSTNNNKPVLIYTVSDGAVVVKVDGNVVQKVSGNMLDALLDGLHTVRVESTDQAGNAGFAEVSFIIDTNAPVVSITSPASGITKNNTPVLTYTVNEGAVVVKVDGAIVPKVSGNALDALADGTHTVQVESTDAAGNVGSAQVTFTVDTVAPLVTINAVTSPTNVSSQMISGARESNAAIAVSVNTAASVGSVVYPTATTWSCVISGLTTGGNTITVTATDSAGNSAAAGTNITQDIDAPTVTITSPASGPTNNETPLLSYAVSDGTVVVKLDGSIVNKVSENNLDPLADGTHTVQVEATDVAGNTGSASVTFTVDTVAPLITMKSVTSPTRNKTQTVTGTRESGSTVTVKANTSATIGSVSYPSSTTWSCTISNMVTGVNTITATAKDAAGNTASASRSITVK